jgi:hypothetical protein
MEKPFKERRGSTYEKFLLSHKLEAIKTENKTAFVL